MRGPLRYTSPLPAAWLAPARPGLPWPAVKRDASEAKLLEAKRLLQTACGPLSASEPHQDSFGEALFYSGMAQLLGARSYDAVRRVDDLLVEVRCAGAALRWGCLCPRL